ncbi:Zn-ribbon domain-containing OB-fold protein [Halosolutus gelatinilyticus]|uniref:Zn-ribbon domain-containing OB-fold protein n=1 Tax=Halosolutus gelatinilyticus TaxID=2931975 RepID=UPI001FF30613|nr:hypothetical protein [Halosolutus gelatinilyticus]
MTDRNSSSETPPVPADRAFVCTGCGRRWYYTRSRCPDCGADESSTYELGDGELVARTEIAVTPPDVRSPNWIGLVRFGDIQLIAQLDANDVSIGDRVTFAGSYRLRDGIEAAEPRLIAVE